MIESLRIENFAVVEEIEFEFGPGLNVLTGETGAGKSIVLGALALLVGARVTPGVLREGAESGRVEALFRSDALPDLERELVERGLAYDVAEVEGSEGRAAEVAHELVVSRTLARNGRSRARVGGEWVPASTLAELFAGRVEISSQHSSQSLLRPEMHGLMLDAAGGLTPLREAVHLHYENVRRLDGELEERMARGEQRARQRDYLAFQLAEIDEVALEPGEIARVEAEHARLGHAEQLREQGGAALQALTDVENGAPGQNAADRVALTLQVLESSLRFDPRLEDLVERLRTIDMELRDLALDLERHLDGIEVEPARLAQLDQRLAQIERLQRKYGRDEQPILDSRERIAAELEALDDSDSRIENLRSERAREAGALAECAAQLSLERARSGRALASSVETALHELGLRDARFRVELGSVANRSRFPKGVDSGPSGAEAPEFRFSANVGAAPQPLQKVASGGELSRVFLAVKNALRETSSATLLVFDEVDAGVGGREAERVGRLLAELAGRHQVLCITHQPQIAALAQTHFRVCKSRVRGGVRARVERLDGEGRVEEIARMAGGAVVSEITRQHARELLRAAATYPHSS